MLDVGAGSGIDRPDWMHASVASVATEAVGVELDPRLSAAGPGMGIRRRRRRRPDPRSRPHVRRGVGGGDHRAPVVRGRVPRRGPASSRARRPARDHHAQRVRGLQLRLSHRRPPSGQQGPHVLVRRGHPLAAVAPPRIRESKRCRICRTERRAAAVHSWRVPCDRCCRVISPRTRCSSSRPCPDPLSPDPADRSAAALGGRDHQRAPALRRRRERAARVAGGA